MFSSCAARAGAMVGMVLPGDCSGFPRSGSGGAPVADRSATGRSLGSQDHRIERTAVSGESHPADSVPGNHRSCQVEPLLLNQRQLHEATLPSYHSGMNKCTIQNETSKSKNRKKKKVKCEKSMQCRTRLRIQPRTDTRRSIACSISLPAVEPHNDWGL